jgi:hypothetical protein
VYFTILYKWNQAVMWLATHSTCFRYSYSTFIYSLTGNRRAILAEADVGKTVERGAFYPSWWECKLAQPLGKTVWRFFKKLHRAIEIPFLGIYPREMKSACEKDICTSMDSTT